MKIDNLEQDKICNEILEAVKQRSKTIKNIYHKLVQKHLRPIKYDGFELNGKDCKTAILVHAGCSFNFSSVFKELNACMAGDSFFHEIEDSHIEYNKDDKTFNFEYTPFGSEYSREIPITYLYEDFSDEELEAQIEKDFVKKYVFWYKTATEYRDWYWNVYYPSIKIIDVENEKLKNNLNKIRKGIFE